MAIVVNNVKWTNNKPDIYLTLDVIVKSRADGQILVFPKLYVSAITGVNYFGYSIKARVYTKNPDGSVERDWGFQTYKENYPDRKDAGSLDFWDAWIPADNDATSKTFYLDMASDAGWERNNAEYSGNVWFSQYYTSAGAPIVSINDNRNNTYSVTAVTGGAGVNNAPTGTDLYWTIDGRDCYWNSTNYGINIRNSAGQSYTTTNYTINNNTQIKARGYTSAPKGNVMGDQVSKSLIYYGRPVWVGGVSLNYTGSRPTTRSTYVAMWEDSVVAANNNSPVNGYRVRLYINGVPNQFGNNDYFETANTAFQFSSGEYSITLKKGDSLIVTVHAYTHMGNSVQLFDDDNIPHRSNNNVPVIVQSMGTMRIVDANRRLQTGQVKVYNGIEWKSSQRVFQCVSIDAHGNPNWKESI